MVVEEKTAEIAEAESPAYRAHRLIGDSWMGWAALYAILMLLDHFTR